MPPFGGYTYISNPYEYNTSLIVRHNINFFANYLLTSKISKYTNISVEPIADSMMHP